MPLQRTLSSIKTEEAEHSPSHAVLSHVLMTLKWYTHPHTHKKHMCPRPHAHVHLLKEWIQWPYFVSNVNVKWIFLQIHLYVDFVISGVELK